MANRGLQLAAAEEQRRTLNSIYAAVWQRTLILLFGCWRCPSITWELPILRSWCCVLGWIYSRDLSNTDCLGWSCLCFSPLSPSSQAGSSFLFRTSEQWNNSLHALLSTHERCWFLHPPGDTGLLQTATGGTECCSGGSSLLWPGIHSCVWAVTECMSKRLFRSSSGFKVFVQIPLKLLKDLWCCNGLWIWPQVSVYTVCLLFAGLWVWNSAERTFGEYIECANLHNDRAQFKAIWLWIYVEIPPSMLQTHSSLVLYVLFVCV